MRRKRRRGGEEESVEINLTPLIDVVFVVLIVFIIVAPMLEIERLELSTGSQAETKKLISYQEPSELKIEVREDNTIWVEKQCVRLQDLKGVLISKKVRSGNVIPQLFQDERSSFGTYNQVKNALEEAGYEEVDLILKPGRR